MRSCILICLLLFTTHSYCQDSLDNHSGQKIPSGEFSLSVYAGVPSEAMRKAIRNNMGNLGLGMSLQVLFNPFIWGKNNREGPLRLGAEIGYTYYGRFKSELDINGYRGDYKTGYGIGGMNAILGFRPGPRNNVTPFVDVTGGFDLYLSRTTDNLTVIESALGTQKRSWAVHQAEA